MRTPECCSRQATTPLSALASTHDDHSTAHHTKTWDGLEKRPGFQFLRPSPYAIPHQHISNTCIHAENQGREGGRLSAMTQGTCLPNRPQALSSPQSLGSLSAIPFHMESPNQGNQAYRWGHPEVKYLSTPRVGHPIFPGKNLTRVK